MTEEQPGSGTRPHPHHPASPESPAASGQGARPAAPEGFGHGAGPAPSGPVSGPEVPGPEVPPHQWDELPGPDGTPQGWPEYAEPPPEPSRVSPLMMLIDPVRNLRALILPLAGVLFVGGFSPTSIVWAAVGVGGAVVFAVVQWFTFRYQIIGDRLELTKSLIGRSVRTIPLDRIRGVDISTPPLHRLLGLVVLRIDTGATGGDEEEGELSGITKEEAARLKTLLMRRSRSAPAPEADATAVTVPPREQPADGGETKTPDRPQERVFSRVPRRWLRYGPLSGAYVLTPFAVIGAAVGLFFNWGREIGLGKEEGDAGLVRIARDAGLWLLDRPVLLAAVILLLVLAMPVVGGVMYALFNWQFTLLARGDHLVAERGLTTRRSVSLERRRVRGYEIVDSPTERIGKVARVWAIVTGLGNSQTRGQLLPVVPKSHAWEITAEAVTPFSSPLRPHPPAARRRALVRAIVPWLVAALVPGWIALTVGGWPWWTAAGVALGFAVLGVPLGLDHYRSLGHTYDGVRISVRSGSLRRSQAVIEKRAIVGWTLSQSWTQRRSGLLTVTAGVGAGTGGYAARDVATDDGVAFAADVTPDWIRPFLLTQPGEEKGA
ncbi:PH domain-containing protein [Sinosporangium siamense]|uniref:YdbS-like PH domain-containing protein n=1 Tax=Sinosporangium siamense TaxID=1367973 RepID=A0A919RDN5_9ACTN|nr:PH domain-containing protein [Sinosporangium siamense]GII91963.1 hypothetical protein Ssi02_21940 [Sinosporangium siamense]